MAEDVEGMHTDLANTKSAMSEELSQTHQKMAEELSETENRMGEKVTAATSAMKDTQSNTDVFTGHVKLFTERLLCDTNLFAGI